LLKIWAAQSGGDITDWPGHGEAYPAAVAEEVPVPGNITQLQLLSLRAIRCAGGGEDGSAPTCLSPRRLTPSGLAQRVIALTVWLDEDTAVWWPAAY
jgi:hypothetical protein